MVVSAHFVKSTPLRALIGSFQHFENIVTGWRLVPAFGDQGKAKTASLVLSGFLSNKG